MSSKITFIGIIALVGTAATACGPSSAPPDEARSASETAPPPATALDIVQASRPDDEAQLLKSVAVATANIDAPNDIVRDQISGQKTAAWKTTVSKLGQFRSWTGRIKDIHDTGWFSISLNDTLEFDSGDAMANGGDDRPNPDYKPWLFSSIKKFTTGEPVRFSGYINPEYSGVCFSIDTFNFTCEVKLTSISAL